ncbi:MAG: DnaJ domain-containing protein [Candidatus Helarchaeota archaeon]|nr:DnaJ domain-containing protein [Candidatus Helarchaeota archaeon]
MKKNGMNVLYDESKIGRFNYKKFSPEDRIRVRELRMEIRGLWLPEREKDIREWRRIVGINAIGELAYFASLSRKQKREFFNQAYRFIDEIKSEMRKEFENIYESFQKTREYCCQILGVKEDSKPGEIKKRYRTLVLVHHPDKGGDPEMFIKVHEAYKYLTE